MIEYDYSEDCPTYGQLLDCIARLKKIYKDVDYHETNLYGEFSKELYVSSVKKRKKVATGILEELSILFEPVLSKYQCTIFLNGSFARGTCRRKSDVDLNFLYDDKYRKHMACVEELFCYAVSAIMCIERDRIHTITMHLIKEHFVFGRGETVKIKFNTGESVIFCCRDNSRGMSECNRMATRSRTDLLKYINENFYHEWSHSFYFIRDNSFENDLVYDVKSINFQKYSQLIKKICFHEISIESHAKTYCELKERIKDNQSF